MKISILLIGILFTIELCESTLSPPTDNAAKKDKGKLDNKKGPVDRDAAQRGLIVKDPKAHEIIRDSGLYYAVTSRKSFHGDVLGYITPWNANGFGIAKTFYHKFSMVSPVWLTFPLGNATKFQLATHDIQRKWLKDMRSISTTNHTTKVLPRVLFNEWSANDIVNLHTDTDRQAQLVTTLIDTAKNFQFNGYVLEMWNQFVFTGVSAEIVTSLIKSIAVKLNNSNLDVILAIPPSRGIKVQLFTREHFNELAPHIKAFSLMTYDYSNFQNPGPNSPLEWIRQCVQMLVPQQDDSRRAQILIGINFYGYNYTPEGGTAILGNDNLKLLKSIKGKIQWDDKSKEHFFEVKSAKGSGIVFYPTLYSLKHRLDLATKLHTGISIWELGQGLHYFYDLL